MPGPVLRKGRDAIMVLIYVNKPCNVDQVIPFGS